MDGLMATNVIVVSSFNMSHLQLLLKLIAPRVADESQLSQLNAYADTLEAYLKVKDSDQSTATDLHAKLKILQKTLTAQFIS